MTPENVFCRFYISFGSHFQMLNKCDIRRKFDKDWVKMKRCQGKCDEVSLYTLPTGMKHDDEFDFM